jgi:hypothetical protein
LSASDNVRSILRQIAGLSPGEVAELRSQWEQLSAGRLETVVKADLQADSKDEAAFKWINEHGGEYPGQWLALDGDVLLAHGPDLSEVASIARARGVQFPLLHLVEPPREHPYIRS